MAPSVSSKVPFHNFASILEKISKLSGNDKKKKLIENFITEWRQFHQKLHADDDDQTDSFFPAMRLLLPLLDRDREAYGIKEHTLAKLYIELLGLGKDSPNAQKLLNYRAPKTGKSDAGDFASIAFWILKDRCPEKGTLTIKDINDCLDGIASGNAMKDKTAVRKNLLHLLKNTSALEQKWLIRIIMKDLKLGINKVIFSSYHEDAEDLFNVKMSLEKVCTILKNPKVRLHEIEVSLFSPFRPMLGQRGEPKSIEKLMGDKSFFVETKFDGERMQLHKSSGEYKYFSRGGNEYTDVYGSDRQNGNFTPFIADCFKPNVKSCILDGEMVGYHAETKTIGSKGENFDIKSRNITYYQPMMCVFDILLYNGQILTNKTLRERRNILKDLFNDVEGRIILSVFTEKQTKQECVDALNEAIDRREEGIMVKDPDSAYKPNCRIKGGWYKIKPEYFGELTDELDLLVVGGYFGVGSRSHMMSHFLCAVAVATPGDDKPKTFQTFCKVGSGYTRKELFDFNRLLADHWVPFDKKSPPFWLEFASGYKQKPDAIIQPDKSMILQIKAAEITDSDQYKSGCTLRFPRVEKIRTDKPWYNCMTVADLTDLKQKSDGKLAGKHMDLDNGDGEMKKKRGRTFASRYVKPTVGRQFRGVDSSAVEKVSEIFDDKEFCVITGSSEVPKCEIEKKILEFGGTIVQNPDSNTFCVIADKITIKVNNVISKGVYDVVKVDWLLRCIDQKRLLPWIPLEMIHTSSKTSEEFAQDYDRHGDCYYDDTTEDELRNVFHKIQDDNLDHPTSEEIAEIEMRYFPHDSVNGLFRLIRVYVDNCCEINEPETRLATSGLDLVALDMRLHGATVHETIDRDVSHVVVDKRDLSRLDTLRELNRKRKRLFHIVSSDWVYDSIEEKKMLQERTYDVE